MMSAPAFTVDSLVIIHLPDDASGTFVPVPAVVVEPGEEHSTIQLRDRDSRILEISVDNELLSER
jgi:hypothetical protein